MDSSSGSVVAGSHNLIGKPSVEPRGSARRRIHDCNRGSQLHVRALGSGCL